MDKETIAGLIMTTMAILCYGHYSFYVVLIVWLDWVITLNKEYNGKYTNT